ncbi:MAG: Ig-like domain-containing protein [Firmicutes bacterium]|nr:Ig-like domain-containing protein [Bacillota bacterium]
MLEWAKSISEKIKTNTKALCGNTAARARRVKFFVSGVIHNPPTRSDILAWLKKAKTAVVSNPRKYIPAAKTAAYFALLAAVVTAILLAAADINRTGFADASDDSTVIPRYVSFLSEKQGVNIELNWTDGVAELVDGKAEMKLRATVTPSFLNDLQINWESSDEEIASVDNDGNVKATKVGTVYITASIMDGKYSETAELTVIQPITGLFMNTSNVTLYAGGSGQNLKVSIFPEDATETELVWESADTDVATVSSSGRVKPVGAGMTEVTASTKDGKYSCKSFITVVNYSVQVSEVSIKNEDSELRVGDSLSLVASVSPYNAKNKTLIWSTSDESVATVSQTGRVKAVGEGGVTITAQSVNGVKTSIELTVLPSEGQSEFDLNDYSTEAAVVGSGSVTYTPYSITLPGMVQIQTGLSPASKIWRNGGYQTATEAEIAEYINPANYCDDVYKYQFLDLSATNGISVEALNEYLADKGVLAGMGEAFKTAAQRYNISEIYLVAHAALETGNGTSQLSTGVAVNGTTVYNVYGIGAYDDSAVSSGSQRAYSEGWTSVEEAIIGGAEWISENYINSTFGRQNTLYKMLWNPDNPGQHQYATDITWAVKQSESMAKIFEQFPDAELSYNIPVYSGQTAPELGN